MKKKILAFLMMTALTATALIGCGKNESTDAPKTETLAEQEIEESDFDYDNDIAVISREDGSGTRGSENC